MHYQSENVSFGEAKQMSVAPKQSGFPTDLPIEQLPLQLKQYESELTSHRQRSSIVGWLFLVCGLGDALLVSTQNPSLSTWLLGLVRSMFQSRWADHLVTVDRFGAFFVVGLQFIFLAIAAAGLRRSPWGAWMGRALRHTSVWSCASTLFSPEFRADILKLRAEKGSLQARVDRWKYFFALHKPTLASGLVLVCQLYLWLKIWAAFADLRVSLPKAPFVPGWVFYWAFAAFAFVAAWLLITVVINLFRDKTAILGIAVGLGVVIVGFVYGQSTATGLFAPSSPALLEGTRWWAVGVVFLSLLVLATLSLDSWDTGRIRSVRLDPRSSTWLYIPFPDLRASALPPLRFQLESPEQSIVVLRREKSGDFRLHDTRTVISPTEQLYEVLNLSNLGKQSALTVDVESPDKSFKLKLRFLTNVVPPDTIYTVDQLRSFVLAGPPVRRIIQAFFRPGEGQIATLPPIMSDVVRIWLGKRVRKVEELSNRCDAVVRSATLGTNLARLNGHQDVGDSAEKILAKLKDARGGVDLAAKAMISRLEQLSPAQFEVLLIETELIEYEEFLGNAKQFIEEKFQALVQAAVAQIYSEDVRQQYQPTIKLLLGVLNLDLTTVAYEELPRLKELRKKLQATKESLIAVNKLDTSIEKALGDRDATIVKLLLEAIKGGMPPDMAFGRSMDVLLGSPALPHDKKPSLPSGHQPPV